MAEAKPLSFSRTKCAETRVTSRSIPHHAELIGCSTNFRGWRGF
jgi:hypothetical protein